MMMKSLEDWVPEPLTVSVEDISRFDELTERERVSLINIVLDRHEAYLQFKRAGLHLSLEDDEQDAKLVQFVKDHAPSWQHYLDNM